MGAYEAAAMWETANVNISQQRVIQRHLDSFFGKRFIVPEHSVRDIGRGALVAQLGSIKGSDNERIQFWYKRVDHVLEHEIEDIIAEDVKFFSQVIGVDIVVGGDHGKGKFRMVLMVVLRTANATKTKRK